MGYLTARKVAVKDERKKGLAGPRVVGAELNDAWLARYLRDTECQTWRDKVKTSGEDEGVE